MSSQCLHQGRSCHTTATNCTSPPRLVTIPLNSAQPFGLPLLRSWLSEPSRLKHPQVRWGSIIGLPISRVCSNPNRYLAENCTRAQEMVQIVLQSLDCRKDAQAAERPSDLPAACPSPHAGPAAILDCSSNQGAPGSLTSQASEGGRSMLESSDLPGSSQCSRVAFFPAEMPPAGASAEQTGHGSSVVGKGTEAADIARPLSWDSCQQIIALAAYPISAWL